MRLTVLLTLLALAPAAFAQRAGTLVVLNKAEATASVVDLATGETVATLPTGVGPHEVAVSPDGRVAVGTDYGDQAVEGASLTVIDLDSREVRATVPLGEWERPHGIAFLPDGRVAVTAERDSAVAVVDLGTGEIVAAPTGQAMSHMLAMSPDGRYAYTGNMMSASVSKVDLRDRQTVATAAVGPVPEAVAVRPGTGEVWAASQEAGLVTVLDGEGLGEVGMAEVGGRPIRIAFTPDGSRALVTSVVSSELTVFDADTRERIGVVSLPNGPETGNDAAASVPGGASALPIGVAVAPDGRTAWVALMGRDQVVEVDLESLSVVRYLDVGRWPDGIAFVPAPR